MSSSKDVLNKALADLLGFEDGAEDVLEHLLSIESSEDLLDYLSQLLGQDGETVKAFVANVGKFQRGEDLAAGNNGVQLETVAKPTISESQQQQDSSHSGQKASPKVNNQGSKQNQQQGRGNKQQPTKMSFSAATSGVKKPAGAQTKKNTTKPSPPVPKKNSPVTPAAKKPVPKKKQTVAPPKRAPPPPKSHPKKGEASHVCGCFGTVHEALSNCLYCGRISCLKEGFDFCPFCNLMVEKLDVKPPEDEAKNKAWLHKERLLRFDRDFAQRTVVLDDQEDYYANTTSTWLTENERVVAKEQEEQRRKNMHERKKQTLSLGI